MSSRIYYLDAMRGILMILGVFYHSSLVFSPSIDWWHIHSIDTTMVASFLRRVLHVFRMPSFFLVSGFFVLLTIRRYGADKFVKIRLKRILIPLISTALTLNILQAVILNGENWMTPYISVGWISHLWFLWNLVVYFLLVYFICKFMSEDTSNIVKQLLKTLERIPVVISVLCLAALSIILMVVGKFLPVSFAGISINNILIYAPFFIMGMAFYAEENLLNRFSSFNPVFSTGGAIIFYFLYKNIILFDGTYWWLTALYFKFISMWFGSMTCFYLFKTYLNKPIRILRFLADASYTIYLFHHVLVIIFGLLLIKYGIGGIGGLVLLISLVGFTATSIHVLLISKIKLLSYAFNGK